MTESSSHGKRQPSRQLRERKQRKLYSDDWALGDEDIEGRRSFSIQDKLDNPRFAAQNLVREMHGHELTLAYFQRHGFSIPLLFKDKSGLGLRVPSTNFSVNDVRTCVGSRRVLDVMDVNTQKNFEMTMKEWQKYYDDENKDRLLNVISLEFSHTKLENYVKTPTVVRMMDWVDNVWPRHLKEQQIEATNLLEDMMYPKVQKYCLMSVKGCYTDFHVDFGGTSVWYHILKGRKVFWLIPPTERNLQLYEQWVLSGKQSDIFFGDTVEKCGRIVLTGGNTFFIPTGWIHAVYTPQDSLVFGGNFLHSFGIEKQLKIAQVEDATKVPQKFRYPFFTEMLWYVLERYVHCLLGRSHLSNGSDIDIPPDRPHTHLTQAELHGLKAIVMYLHMLPGNKKSVPELLKDPVALIQDVRTLVGIHRQDNRDLAVTGLPVLFVPEDNDKPKYARHSLYSRNLNTPVSRMSGGSSGGERTPSYKLANSSGVGGGGIPGGGGGGGGMKVPKAPTPPGGHHQDKDKGGPRRRRTRCKKCEACQRNDCGECSFCLDMVKFGGPGRAKQTCNMRQCLQPMLPVTAACSHCGLDGWGQAPVVPLQKGPMRCEGASALMECSVCYEIAHPACVQRLCPQVTGFINEDMPNSWECPMCCKSGKNSDYRPRHFRARQKSSDMRRMSISSDASSAVDHKLQQDAHFSDSGSENERESKETQTSPSIVPLKKRRSSECDIETKPAPQPEAPRKLALRMQLAHQLSSNSTKILKKPMFVVRPAPILLMSSMHSSNVALDKRCVLSVFRYLAPTDLYKCSLVCKTWAQYTIDPSLWRRMDFSQKRINSEQLKGIVRRQPEVLILDWSHINKFQLSWLIARLSSLRELSMRSVNVKSVLSLRTCYCASLQILDVSFCSGFNDSALREILSPNNDSRRGLADEKARFRNLKTLRLAGTDISDIALRYVTQYLPSLSHLDLSSCARVTDAGVAQLSTKPASTVANLVSVDLSHCKMVTESSLEHLARCEALTRLDFRHAPQVSTQALIKFAAKSEHNLQVRDIKLIDIRQKT